MPLTQEQLEERRGYIGASEAAAVLGLSRWRTPLEVFAIKTGLVEPENIDDRLPVRVGVGLEDLVAKIWCEETGKKVQRANETRFHKVHPFLACNIDRLVIGEDAGLECKTASAWKAKEWDGDEIPQEYLIQCHHSMLVTGKKAWYIACLIGGNQTFAMKRVERDEALLVDMTNKLVHFWKAFVEQKVMPGIITKDDSDILHKLYPGDESLEPVELPPDALGLVEQKGAYAQDLKVVKGNLDRIDNELKAMMGDNTIAVAGNHKVTWKPQNTTRIDSKRLKAEQPDIAAEYSKTSASRVLRVAEIKAKKAKRKEVTRYFKAIKAKWGMDGGEFIIARLDNGSEDCEIQIVSNKPGEPWKDAQRIAGILTRQERTT